MDSHPCDQDGCPGTCRYVDDEFAEGGSFEVWLCDTCATTTRIPLPD